jgi:hypothetical protein
MDAPVLVADPIPLALLVQELLVAEPPFLPASLAFSLPGSNEPLEAWPPLEAISR